MTKDMNELNNKLDEMVGKSDRNVSKVYQTSKDLDDIFDQLFRSTGFSRQAAQQFQPYIYQATQAIQALIEQEVAEQVRLGSTRNGLAAAKAEELKRLKKELGVGVKGVPSYGAVASDYLAKTINRRIAELSSGVTEESPTTSTTLLEGVDK